MRREILILCEATFSWDGRSIYAINGKQEICQIDFQGSRVVLKRKIEGLSNPEKILSSYIQQVNPLVFAIGSFVKVESKKGEVFKPWFHLVSGDFSDEEKNIQIKMVLEVPSSPFKSKVIFRSLYIKER